MPKSYGKPHDPDQKHFDVIREGSDKAWLQDRSKMLDGAPLFQVSCVLRTSALLYGGRAVPWPFPATTTTLPFTSTQNPNSDQAQIAKVMWVNTNNVSVLVEQLGGGFGWQYRTAPFLSALGSGLFIR